MTDYKNELDDMLDDFGHDAANGVSRTTAKRKVIRYIEALLSKRELEARVELASDILIHPYWDRVDLRRKYPKDFRNDIWDLAKQDINQLTNREEK
jgi:hypothetical protein